MIRNQVLLCRNDRTHPYWRTMPPRNLEYRVLSGHPGTDKCVRQISRSFHIKNLGRKVRRYVAHCDICQGVKHPNRAFEIVSRSHLPTKPGELLIIGLDGPLPTGIGGVKQLLECLDVFSKHVTLYPLKAATARSCLNKLTNQYFTDVTKPKNVYQITDPSSPALHRDTLFQTWGLKSLFTYIRKVITPSELCDSWENISEFIATRHIRNGRSWHPT
jgi:hypothetical protein